MAEAVCVPAHLALPGSLEAKQLCHLHAQPFTGAELSQAKKVLNLDMTLWTVACQASLSGGFSRKEYWSVLANTGCHTLLEHYISCSPKLPTPLSTWCCQNPYNPSSCITSTPGTHCGRPKSSRATSGANPSG